jgi:hypothetical protein
MLNVIMLNIVAPLTNNDIHHNVTQHNNIQHNDTRHKGLACMRVTLTLNSAEHN